MKRTRAIELLAGAGVAALASPLGAQTATSTPVRVGTFAGESTGAVFYAQDEGFMAKHGITVDINTATGGAAVMAAIVGGSLDVGEADVVTMAIAHDKGIPFVFIAPGELHSIKVPTLALVVGDPALKIGKDFNGKTMASNVARGFGSLVANAWIDNNGGDSKTVKWVELPFPALAAAVQRGTIDGYSAPEPFITAGLALGGHLVLLDKNPVAPVILQGGWFASKDWIAKNRATASGFAAAINEANAWGNANATGSAEIISKYTKIPVAAIESTKMRGQYQTAFDLATVQPLIDAAAKYGYISARFPAGDMITKV